jgi:hypothetical protein
MTTRRPHGPFQPGDPKAFWALRELPLHDMSDAAWEAYYPAMVPWLTHNNAEIRDCAVERLSMAVMRAEYSSGRKDAKQSVPAAERLAWLLAHVERAHEEHVAVLPRFLRGLRYHGDHEPFQTPLLAWLETIAERRVAGVDAGLVQGTQIILERVTYDDLPKHMTRWIALLDHPSDYVRGCASTQLGEYCDEESVPTADELFDLIGAKEVVRPGIAGPFWSPQSFLIDAVTRQRVTGWMLDLLEQRRGAVPAIDDMPANDIEFHLHELCSLSPDLMWRMIRGGHMELALMTATEMLERIEGVEPVLERLAADANLSIAGGAKRHLQAFYREATA